MKTQPTTDNGQRTTNKQDWRLYAAAGVAALAAGSAADAAIIYVNPTAKPTATGAAGAPNGEFLVDGVETFVNIGSGHRAYVGATSRVGGLQWAQTGSVNAQKFFKGDLVNSAAFAVAGPQANLNSNGGLFTNNKINYAAFQLPESKGGGFGWMQLEPLDINNDGVSDGVEAIAWAYNDAGGPITIGQTGSVPEPSALGLLAMGSAGLLAWRRRRTAGGTESVSPSASLAVRAR